MPPVTTSANSPNSLPPVGYTIDQLADYIFRQLGQPVFTVEISRQQVIDCINDALAFYSTWRPAIKYGSIGLQAGQHAYCKGEDLGLGPVSVDFVIRTPLPQALFWGNLIDVAPLMMAGLDDYDTFLRWQKTWLRVTSTQPDWVYDQMQKILWIHNPVSRYQCGIVAYVPFTESQRLDRYGADWVKRYSFQKARMAYGEIMSKFSGVIPGPVKDLQFDQQKRDRAEKEIEKLENEVKAAQVSTPISID